MEDGYARHLLVVAGCSPETVRTYVANVSLFYRWTLEGRVPFLQADREQVIRYLAGIIETLSRSSARNRLLALRSYYRYAVAEGWRQDDPTDGIKAKHPRHLPVKPYSAREKVALRDACLNDRDRAIVLTFIGTGLRLSELLGIQAESIDWRSGTIQIRGKGDKERWVAPGIAALSALRQIVNGPGPVFRTRQGRPVNRGRARKIIYAAATRAEVNMAFPHRFRATYAHDILASGGELMALSESLGHARIEQTAQYAAYWSRRRALEQMRRLSPADRL